MFVLNLNALSNKFIFVVSFIFISMLFAVTPFDQELSRYFALHYQKTFVTFQSQSLFEGSGFGGSDLGLFFQISCSLYLIQFLAFKRSNCNRDLKIARFCAFVALSSLYYAVIFIHGLKFAVGRARPYLVFGEFPHWYSDWFEAGALSILNGNFAGSFPSGHSASVSSFFALLFIVPTFSANRRNVLSRFYPCIMFLSCFMLWALMAIARVMGRDHWPTDCVASALFVFLSYAFFAKKFELGTKKPMTSVLPAGALKSYCRVLTFSLLVILLFWISRETISSPSGFAREQ